MPSDPRIDAYITKAASFAQPILTHLRALTHATVTGLDESIKWSMPALLYKGKNLVTFSAFKAHCAFMIHGDGRQGEAMGQYGKLTALSDLPGENVLKSKIIAAKERIDAEGTALRRKPLEKRVAKPELPVPSDFAEALSASPAAKETLDNFSPSQRREYVEWITEAKRPETRDKRIVQAVEWLAEGKSRNWKYQNC
jgi:uncharacterized protein YdeI (YjbR/CyaY-like superfamily)